MSLLKDINLNETQEKEVAERLEAWKKNVEESIKAKYENEIKTLKESVGNKSTSKITEDGDLDLNEEESEILKKKLVEWKEKIKNQTEEELGDKFYEAFTAQKKKMSQAYSDKFIKTIKEMYEEIETATKEKIMESAEFKAFLELKKIVAPFIIEGEYTDTVLEDTKKLKGIIEEQAQKLENIKIKSKLDQLTEGMPEKIKADFIESLGSFKTEDELIEKFTKHMKLVKNVKETLVTEMASQTKQNSKVEALDESGDVKDTDEQLQDEVEQPEAVTEAVKTKTPAPKKAGVKVETPKVLAESVEEDLEEKIDYQILSEEFKREVKKPDTLTRMRELAGL